MLLGQLMCRTGQRVIDGDIATFYCVAVSFTEHSASPVFRPVDRQNTHRNRYPGSLGPHTTQQKDTSVAIQTNIPII